MLVLAIVMGGVGEASAQSTSGSGAPAPLTASWQDGLVLQSGDGANRFQLGALLQFDGRFSLDDPPAITDTFTVRKARLVMAGRLARYFEFRLVPDFGNGTATLADGYLETRLADALRIRAGKDKVPIGYEWMMGDASVWFPERSLASGLVPQRDVGVEAVGDLAGGRVSYGGGVFNGIPDGTTSSADVDSNGGKDVAGRVVVQPWRRAPSQVQNQPGVLNGLGFHVGGSVGSQSGALPSFKTSVGQTYFTYAPGAVADGRRTRVTPAAFFLYRSFGAIGEYVLSTQDVTRPGLTRAIANHGVDVSVSYFLTGESATTGLPRPRKPFDPEAGHWGALQVLARYSKLEVDGSAFVDGFAAATASRKADQWTVAVNWYPTSFVKWYVMVERTSFEGGAVRPVEHAVLLRGQLSF